MYKKLCGLDVPMYVGVGKCVDVLKYVGTHVCIKEHVGNYVRHCMGVRKYMTSDQRLLNFKSKGSSL